MIEEGFVRVPQMMIVNFDGRKNLFPLGELVITTNAHQTLNMLSWIEALRRHQSGDWGDIHPGDRGLNEDALEHGNRILSVYSDRNGTKFWIITEADRSVTTILLPEDY